MQALLLLCTLVGLNATEVVQSVRVPSREANVRMEQLLFESEDFGDLHGKALSFWRNDQPSHITYQRVHGGIGP